MKINFIPFKDRQIGEEPSDSVTNKIIVTKTINLTY